MSEAGTEVAAVAEAPEESSGHFRWTICALLFFATTVNYADRQMLGILAPTLQREIGWSEAQYGLIVTAFQGAYAIGLLGMGRFIDRVGTRLGYSLALGWWSVAAMLHGLAASALGLRRRALPAGAGPGRQFPRGHQDRGGVVPEARTGAGHRHLQFRIERGRDRGAAAGRRGWRCDSAGDGHSPVLGGAGLVWIVAWLLIYREPARHPRLSRAELDYIRSEPPESAEHIPWRVLIANRPVWGLLLARFLTDPVWWFYLYWAPKFLNSQFGLESRPDRRAGGGHVPGLERRGHLRRLVLLVPDRAGLRQQRRAQAGHAGVRA